MLYQESWQLLCEADEGICWINPENKQALVMVASVF